jgi:DNA polymerase III subunit beta
MKFSVSTSALAKQLQIAAGALTSNPVMPVLEDFLLDLKGNSLSISASNLEVTINTLVEVSGSKNGRVAIPGKTILEVLKSLPEQPLQFEISPETRGIELTSASGKYKLVGENPAEFPALESPSDKDDKIEINTTHLKRGIDKSAFAASNDEMRNNLRGINFNIDFNQITFATTDAQKLVRYKFFDVNSNIATSILLTKKSMQLLSTILPKDKTANLYFNKSKAFFEFDSILFATRLIDAKFPDYNAVIPVDNTNIMTIGREELLSTLKRLSIFSNKTTSQVVFSLSDGSLTMNAQDFDFNNEATEQLSCTYEGDSINIGLSAKNLIEMLSTIESESVSLFFNAQNNKPVLLEPAEQDNAENLLMLIVTNS